MPEAEGSKFIGETCWPVSPAYSEHGGHIMLLCEDGRVLQIVHPPAAQIEYVNVIDPIVRELVKSKIQLEKGK
jgi:hypothetical protein